MNPSLPDAFNDSGKSPHRSLAAALSPLEARLVRDRSRSTLTLSPMRAVDALSALAAAVESGSEPAYTLLFDVRQSAWRDGRFPSSPANVARRLAIAPVEEFDDDVLSLGDQALLALVGVLQPEYLRAVRIEGPIEARDAKALVAAAVRGESPLDADLRARASVILGDDRRVRLESRDLDDPLSVVARALARYAASVLRRPTSPAEPPELAQVERLLGVSGWITVRPIETEVRSTSIDVGISTRGPGESGPANTSLIYDIPSRTWHNEQ